MKIKALLATLIGAVALNGAMAGEWCPKAPVDKCPVDSCPTYGNISFGYDSDYVWKGVRFARDFIWTDVNYTFEGLGLPLAPTIGVWHGTDLSSNIGYGDETNIYGGVTLPEVMGFEASLLQTWYAFPNQRTPGGPNGDSIHSTGLHLSRDVFGGLSANLGSELYYGVGNVSKAWYHYAEASYGIEVTDCVAVDIGAGVAYSDNLFGNSGWNHYYVKTGLSLALSKCATLSPYIAYNGTPDTWVADGVGAIPGANHNDVFYWGVSLSVDF